MRLAGTVIPPDPHDEELTKLCPRKVFPRICVVPNDAAVDLASNVKVTLDRRIALQ
jgi:hypothetical protein